jgi:hypothetical protein
MLRQCGIFKKPVKGGLAGRQGHPANPPAFPVYAKYTTGPSSRSEVGVWARSFAARPHTNPSFCDDARAALKEEKTAYTHPSYLERVHRV